MVRINQLGVVAAASLWMFTGCGTEADGGGGPVTELGTAQITIQDEAHLAASARVVAKVASTGALAGETLVTFDGKTSVDAKLDLTPGMYVVDVRAFADIDGKVLLGSKSSMVGIDLGLTAKLGLKLDTKGLSLDLGAGLSTGLDLKGGVGGKTGAGLDLKLDLGLTGGVTGGGPTTPPKPAGGGISLNVPIVESIDVQIGLTNVKIDVKAKASAGGALTFIWSGAGIGGAISGSASAELSVAAILEAAIKDIKIVIQTDAGVAVQATVKLDLVTSLLGVLKLSGTVSTTIDTAASVDLSVKLCFEAHAKCTAECSAAAAKGELKLGCLVNCALKLATCN